MRNVMAHAQKPDFVFPRNGRVHSNRWGRQFSRLLAAEVCASALVMLDTPCCEVVWEYWLPTPFASFPFTSPSRASPCAITFRTQYTKSMTCTTSAVWWPALFFQTTSSEGVLCDKYGVETFENEGDCLYGCMSATWAVKQKKSPIFLSPWMLFLVQDLSWNIYSRQVDKFSAVMEPEF